MAWRLGSIRNGLGWLALACALLPAASAAPAQPSLQLGIFPYLPTATLLTTYEPLRQHLAASLKQPVEATTAPNYKEFIKRSLAGEYDLLVMGSGLGRYLEKEAGYVPLVVSRREIRALLLVDAQSRLASIADLKNGRVATLDPFIVAAQLGSQLLRQGGLHPERDVRFSVVTTPFNAAQAVILGEAEAAVVPSFLLTQLTGEMRARLRVLAESPAIAGIAIYARKGAALPPPSRLTNLLLDFNNGETGRRFAEKAQLDGLRPVRANEFRTNDAFLPEIRRQLARQHD
jgi:ABC-type phosphate/phosphonate transport system substrate-binding protein